MYVHHHGLLVSFGICHARVRAQTQIDIIYCIIPFSSDMRMDDLFVCQYVKTSVQIEGVKEDPESFMSTHPSSSDAHHFCCIT
jgi:hypothetical protein